MEKMYYTIGEVATILGESTSLVRYWTTTFDKFVKPVQKENGARKYRPEDIDVLKQIHHLVNIDGYTLEGVEKVLKAGRKKVSSQVKVLESLKDIRQQLIEIKNMI